jgi:SAM-dependent methyltransferase
MDKLRAWKQSPKPHLCLDLRPTRQFDKCRVVPSLNIPLAELVKRQSELPPKHIPMAVIEPHQNHCNPLGSSWLIDRGWTCPWVIHAHEFKWANLIINGLASDKSPILDRSDKPIFFQPSPFLQRHIDQLETTLPSQRVCLDVGCGSGRDIAFLMRRGWRAWALDAQVGAMERVKQVSTYLDVQDRLEVLARAKLLHDGRWRFKGPEIDLSNKKFDLILNIRFLSRSFWKQVPSMLNIGGYFVFSHFVDQGEYEQPKKSHRVEVGELEKMFGDMKNMEIVEDVIELTEDGRPLQCMIIRRVL